MPRLQPDLLPAPDFFTFVSVHSDVRALHLSGVIDKTPEGKMILPYDVIHLDFTVATQQAA